MTLKPYNRYIQFSHPKLRRHYRSSTSPWEATVRSMRTTLHPSRHVNWNPWYVSLRHVPRSNYVRKSQNEMHSRSLRWWRKRWWICVLTNSVLLIFDEILEWVVRRRSRRLFRRFKSVLCKRIQQTSQHENSQRLQNRCVFRSWTYRDFWTCWTIKTIYWSGELVGGDLHVPPWVSRAPHHSCLEAGDDNNFSTYNSSRDFTK